VERTLAEGDDLGRKRVLVMIPAFNEEGSIGVVIAQLRTELPGADVLVIDGYSRDRTYEVAVAAGVHAIRLSSAYSIGGAVEAGFLFAHRHGYDLLARMDGDGQHNAIDLRRLVERVGAGEADVLIGSRYADRQEYRNTLSRTLGIGLFASLVSALTGKPFTDTTSGLMVANREVVRYVVVDYPFDYSEVESIVILHRAGFDVRETAVSMRQRTAGRSSFTAPRAFYYMFRGLLSMLLDLARPVPARAREAR
jgi:glycosyltransferase involved in cell wall biosynthesis